MRAAGWAICAVLLGGCETFFPLEADLPICFSDDFGGPAIGAPWTTSGTGVSADGTLKLMVAGTEKEGVDSSPFDLAGASVEVEMPSAPSTPQLRVVFQVNTPVPNSPNGQTTYAYFQVLGVDLQFSGSPNSQDTTSSKITFDLEQHRWLRFAQEDTDVTFATSSDGQAWKVRATVGLEFGPNSTINLQADQGGGEVRFDHFAVRSNNCPAP